MDHRKRERERERRKRRKEMMRLLLPLLIIIWFTGSNFFSMSFSFLLFSPLLMIRTLPVYFSLPSPLSSLLREERGRKKEEENKIFQNFFLPSFSEITSAASSSDRENCLVYSLLLLSPFSFSLSLFLFSFSLCLSSLSFSLFLSLLTVLIVL